MLDKRLRNEAAQDYEIIVYDSKTIEEEGSLNNHSELRGLCRKIAEDFQEKYKGKLSIRIIIR